MQLALAHSHSILFSALTSQINGLILILNRRHGSNTGKSTLPLANGCLTIVPISVDVHTQKKSSRLGPMRASDDTLLPESIRGIGADQFAIDNHYYYPPKECLPVPLKKFFSRIR